MKKLILFFIVLLTMTPPTFAQDNDPEMAATRLQLLSQLSDDDKIIFKAANEKAKVILFTDITCGFCARFHEQIDAVNASGITVEYLAFPREGLGSDTLQVMQDIWCAPDKKQALTNAKIHHHVPVDSCHKDQIAQQYLLGATLGVYGTPMFVLPNGELSAGYKTPEGLAALLFGK